MITVHVRSSFGRIAAQLEERAAELVSETTAQIADEARATAPIPSIVAGISTEKTDALHETVLVGPWWAGFWEYGTRDIAATGYLTQAAEHARVTMAEGVRALVLP